MGFSELPRLLGWAGFQPAWDTRYIWFNAKSAEPPLLQKRN